MNRLDCPACSFLGVYSRWLWFEDLEKCASFECVTNLSIIEHQYAEVARVAQILKMHVSSGTCGQPTPELKCPYAGLVIPAGGDVAAVTGDLTSYAPRDVIAGIELCIGLNSQEVINGVITQCLPRIL